MSLLEHENIAIKLMKLFKIFTIYITIKNICSSNFLTSIDAEFQKYGLISKQ